MGIGEPKMPTPEEMAEMHKKEKQEVKGKVENTVRENREISKIMSELSVKSEIQEHGDDTYLGLDYELLGNSLDGRSIHIKFFNPDTLEEYSDFKIGNDYDGFLSINQKKANCKFHEDRWTYSVYIKTKDQEK